MVLRSRCLLPACCAFACAVQFCGSHATRGQEAAQSVRSQAVLNLTFEEASGEALDSAVAGAVKEVGKPVNGPVRVKSPFWGQKGKQALLFDGGRKQFLQFDDSADLDRPDAVSLSFFYLNLIAPEDPGAYGIVAKRADEKGANATNYGINYVAKGDIFQLYVNDGTGFRVATYSVQSVLGYRRPVFLTATFEVADAPNPDADTDKDDLLIRLYANGLPVAPKGAANVVLMGNDAWLTDVKVAGLLNDVPLTLGSSNPAIEFTSGIIDEFSLFPKALSADEAARLFVEVAGANAATLVKDEAKPLPGPPSLTELSMNGLQTGHTSSLIITGTNLLPAPVLMLPVPIEKQTLGANSNANRLEFEITLAADLPSGHYPLRVQTSFGASNPLPLAIDPLPQFAAAGAGGGATPDKPLETPVALSGTLSGGQQARAYFHGKAGQRLVVDLECKRLGAAMSPVLEIKNPQGTPLAIEWGQVEHRGDPRAELRLAADGIYLAELHDLAYQAPGANPYRLKIGDLKLVDAVFPLGLSTGTQGEVELVGTGFDASAKVAVDLRQQTLGIQQPLLLPAALGAAAPAPSLFASEATEIVEAPAAAGTLQVVNARFDTNPHLPTIINGRIAQKREQDRYLLQVTPGQKLSFSIATRSIDSSLDPRISI